MALAPINPTQLTPPRVALIDERSGAISREWYRFFLSLLTATQTNQSETELSPDTSSLLASYDAMLADLAQATETQPDCCVSGEAVLASDIQALAVTSPGASISALAVVQSDIQSLALAPPGNSGSVTSVDASGGTTGLTFSGGPITSSGTLTLGGTLAVANGGTNSTSTATAGGVAYGTGTAIVVNAAGPAGYVLTSGGAAPPVWTPVASLAVGTEAYWGSFWDTTTQTAAAINTAYALTLNTADVENNGVTIVSGSRVTFIHAGVYSLTFSAQLTNTDNSNNAHIANIWLRKNGADVTATDSKFTVPGKFGSVQGALIGTVNFVLPLAANDYIELIWSTTDTSVAVTSFPAGTTPVTPVVPSIIFTAVAAAPVGLGYAGVESLTSLTVGTGSQTFTVNTNATDTAFIVGNRVRLVNSSVNYMDGVITAYSGTSMTVLVDGTAGSGTYTAWFVTLTGSVGGVTSFSGNSTGLTPATPTAGAISLAGTLNVANGGTGQTTYTNGQLLIGNTTGNTLAKATLTAGTNVSITNGAGAITINATDQFVGTVTSASVVSANGFAGTVATATTTPAITLTTTITGVLKGNGTAISAATKDVDYFAPSAPITKTADFTIGTNENFFINNKTTTACTVTFPAASSWTGRQITIKNMQAQLVNSASSNVVPIDSTSAGTAILLGVVGNWATLLSDGTNWVIMAQASNNNLLLE